MTTLYDPAYGEFRTTTLTPEEAFAKTKDWEDDSEGNYEWFSDEVSHKGAHILLLENDKQDEFVIITHTRRGPTPYETFNKFLVSVDGERYIDSADYHELEEMDQAFYNTLQNDLLA